VNTIRSSAAASALAAIALAAHAQASHDARPEPRRLGDHPAVVVRRLQAQAGYDYASKFYPHPAWLYLRPSAEPVAALAQQTTDPVAAAGSGADLARAPRRRALKSGFAVEP
jgi:hypothetical protein